MSFSIAGRNLKLNTAEDIQPHLDELNVVVDLKEVHFGGNTLGVEACQALAKCLETKKTLQVADFADIFTGRLITEIPAALKALCDSLAEHESLVELDLSDNAFGGRSAEPMVHFLKTNRHFSILKLNNNGLGVTGGTIIAKALIEAAEAIKTEGKKSSLRTVICGRNRLENGSAPLWAEAFAKHGGLREVRMFQNGIRMEGIEAISRGLSKCPHLEVLDLQDNTATLRGSRAIAAALPSWPELRVLNLSDMLLKPKGGMLVAEALGKGKNLKLETLQMQYDDVDRKGLSALGDAISRHLSALTKLEINGNWADEEDECVAKIKEALEKHGHEDALDELDEMDPEGEESEAEEEDGEADEDEDEKEEEEAPSSTAAPVVAGAGAGAAGTAVAVAAATSSKKEDEASAVQPVEAAAASSTLPASASEQQVDAATQSSRSAAPEAAKAKEAESAAASSSSATAAPSADQQLATLMSNVGIDPSKPTTSNTSAPTAAHEEKAAEPAVVAAAAPQEASAAVSVTPAQEAAAPAPAPAMTSQPPAAASKDEEQKATAAPVPAAATSAPSSSKPATSHAPQKSVDLNDELYAPEPASTSASASTAAQASSSAPAASEDVSAAAQQEQEQQQKKKKGGVKAAFGAIKELLFK